MHFRVTDEMIENRFILNYERSMNDKARVKLRINQLSFVECNKLMLPFLFLSNHKNKTESHCGGVSTFDETNNRPLSTYVAFLRLNGSIFHNP